MSSHKNEIPDFIGCLTSGSKTSQTMLLMFCSSHYSNETYFVEKFVPMARGLELDDVKNSC